MLRSVLALVIFLVAGAMPTALTATARAEELNAYCAKAGSDDRVKPIPAAMVPTARRLFNLEAADDADFVLGSTVYRCMSGSVWLCNHGANTPCAKAELETQAAERHRLLHGKSQRSFRAKGRDGSRYYSLVGMRGRQGPH